LGGESGLVEFPAVELPEFDTGTEVCSTLGLDIGELIGTTEGEFVFVVVFVDGETLGLLIVGRSGRRAGERVLLLRTGAEILPKFLEGILVFVLKIGSLVMFGVPVSSGVLETKMLGRRKILVGEVGAFVNVALLGDSVLLRRDLISWSGLGIAIRLMGDLELMVLFVVATEGGSESSSFMRIIGGLVF
jgi:hypothetical protein